MLGTNVSVVLLFKNVFTAAPAALQLFSFKDEVNLYESKALKKHGAGVINTVGTAVAGLRDFDTLTQLLQVLGRKHLGYGVQPEHFELLGIELLRTLGIDILLILYSLCLTSVFRDGTWRYVHTRSKRGMVKNV
jgi:hemoglobin-like flavoprotein